MSLRTSTITLGFLGGLICLAPWAQAGSPAPLSGEILGEVKGATGVVQMGATVFLYNRYDQLVRQALTSEQGKFIFDALPPDLYSIRVTLASFVPALRRNIAVAAGSKSVLEINLANLLSTVDLISSAPSRGTLMSDDWKWVLRTSQATRPVLRLLPDRNSSSSRPASAIFADTSGLVTLSGGDGGSFTTGSQQDLGTAFALATSIYGSTRMQFSGNFGYAASSGLPTTGFRTTYARTEADGSGPQVTLTIRQLYLPSRAAYAGIVGNDGAPEMRTMSLETRDKIELADGVHLEYGLSFDSVSFLQRLNYVSPFARLTYDLDEKSSLRIAYSSGAQPAELAGRGGEAGPDLTQDLTALAQLPRVSLLDGQAHVQRTQTFEMGYRRVSGSRTYSVGVYHEAVANAALILYGLTDLMSSGDLLPDLGSGSSIFNVGNYQTFGYTAAAAQKLGDHLEASLAAGRGGALTADTRNIAADANDLRGLIHDAQRSWATLRITETLPGSGTRMTTSYGWTDPGAMMPAHLFLTQESNQATGLNFRLRQPLPMFFGLPGRLEAIAEVNNLLAQGYLPLSVAGRRALLTNSPRAVRAGLNFTF
jgi:carboxypeptidase family protein